MGPTNNRDHTKTITFAATRICEFKIQKLNQDGRSFANDSDCNDHDHDHDNNHKGKDPATKSDEFSEKCQRGGGHFQ